ncbi:MAG: hypothetical protein OEZ47_04830, partial [Gammaproteobacteria bacterium]|nr:hypothetical protein [Gammaproteobacteria bacterium]
EFKLICDESLDCRGRPTRVDPLRNTCESTGKNQVKCYRGLRYTFMDDEGGLFGRSTPVSAMGSTRPDIIKPYTFGVAYYQQSYNVTVKSTDPQQQAEPLLTDSYGGIAGFFSIAFNHRYGINTSAYWLNNIDHTNQSKAGGEAQFIVGTNLNQSGFKVLGGVGGFYETWASGDLNAEFYGAQLVLGLGYHARSTSYDFMINMRQTKTYDDHAFSSDVSNVNTSAAGAAFRFGLRF